MSWCTPIVVLLLAVFCTAQEIQTSGHEGHFAQGPVYLANLTKEERTEYFEIFRDQKLTIKEQEAKKLAFAESHGFADMIKEDNKVKADNQAKIKKERPEVIKHLAEINDDLIKIYENTDQTVAEQQDAVDDLKEKYPHAVSTLYYISRLIVGKGVHQRPQRPV